MRFFTSCTPIMFTFFCHHYQCTSRPCKPHVSRQSSKNKKLLLFLSQFLFSSLKTSCYWLTRSRTEKFRVTGNLFRSNNISHQSGEFFNFWAWTEVSGSGKVIKIPLRSRSRESAETCLMAWEINHLGMRRCAKISPRTDVVKGKIRTRGVS